MESTSRKLLLTGAAALAGSMIGGTAFAQAPAGPAALYPTPEAPTCVVKAPTDCRLPDGHPDLTGLWVGGGGGNLGSGSDTQLFAGRGNSFVGFEADGGLYRESNIDSGDANKPNLPQYKPEFWDQIIDNDYNGNFEDPQQDCLPMGVPRAGAPGEIIALDKAPFVELIYSTRELRLVPIDGRPHNLINTATETWDGDAVGHWEGDTLVIETIGFTDASWLHKNGYVHSFNMRVTERLTRTGNALKWEAKVDDPDYLAQPWNLTPVTRQLNVDPNAQLVEPYPCMDIDHLHVTSHVRSG